MRKLILLFSTLSLILILNSCMDAGNETRSGNGQLFYITNSSGINIAISGDMVITSEQIRSKPPGKWYIISWSWTAEQGISEQGVYNVFTSEVIEIPVGSFSPSIAPASTPTPITAFNVVLGIPLINAYGNNLVFTYSWEKAEGESAELSMFYEINVEKINNPIEPIVIDVRLNKRGTASGDVKPVTDIASIDMSMIKNAIQFSSTEKVKEINVKFRYNKSEEEVAETSTIQLKVYKD